MPNFRALGAPPPDPRASGGWGLCPQTPSLRQLGAKPPDPHWPPAAGGSAPPLCEFLATRLDEGIKISAQRKSYQLKMIDLANSQTRITIGKP